MSQPTNHPFILPKPGGIRNVQEDDPSGAGSRPLPKRRRIQAIVACNSCRKRKTGCNGARPTCNKCLSAGITCEYEAPEGLTTQQARKQKIGEVESTNVSFRSVFDLLRQGSDADSAAALQKIREAEDMEGAVAMIADARLLLPTSGPETGRRRVGEVHARWPGDHLLKPPSDDAGYMFSKGYSFVKDQYVDEDLFVDVPGLRLDIARWTTISRDNQLMNHLLTLFWTWDNSVERFMYRPMFEEDLADMRPHDKDPFKHQFCSPFLVNALLALSCLYCLETSTYTNIEDPTTRGRRFADEAKAMLKKEIDTPSVPLFQGLFAMFCYEGNLGEGQKAVQYFLKAIDAYKALNHVDMLRPKDGATDKARIRREEHASSWCMWGFYVTEWRASQPLGFRKLAQKPVVDRTWLATDFPLSDPDVSSFWWFPYPMSLRVQRSMKVEVRQAEFILAEIAEEVLEFVIPDEHSRPAVENPTRALELYDAVLDWKRSLPERLRFEEAVLPSAILIHVFADLLLTAILRPYGQMRATDFSGRLNPRQRCCSHASQMMTAIWTYRAFALLRTEYWLIHPISTAALIVLQDLEPGSAETETAIRACQCLLEMTSTLPLAADCLSTIRGAFRRAEVQLPAYLHRYLGKARHRKDGLMHHAVASLMPTRDPGNSLSFQELLDELKVVTID